MARRHPLVTFFVLAFAFSWAVWAPAVILSRGASDPQTSSALLHLLGSLGPMLSAFVVTALAGGHAGVRELLGRVFRWRVGLGWWVVAVLGTPTLFLVAAVISRLLFGGWPELGEFGRSEEFALLGLLPYWLANVLFFGFGEETGWRGFALPRLQTGPRNALVAALILSLFWAAWHLPLSLVTFWGLAVLAWAGPKNLSKRRRKQEAPDLSAPREARVV